MVRQCEYGGWLQHYDKGGGGGGGGNISSN